MILAVLLYVFNVATMFPISFNLLSYFQLIRSGFARRMDEGKKREEETASRNLPMQRMMSLL